MLLLIFAGTVNVLMPVPQIIRAVKVSVAGISDTTFVVAASMAVIWAIHGYIVKNNMLIISNIVLVLLSTFGIFVISKARIDNKVWLKYFIVSKLFLGLYFFPGVYAKTFLVIFVGFYMRIPQLRKVMIEDDVSGVSISTWAISATTNISWIVIAVIERDSLLLATGVVAVALSSLIIAKVLVKRRALKEIIAVVTN